MRGCSHVGKLFRNAHCLAATRRGARCPGSAPLRVAAKRWSFLACLVFAITAVVAPPALTAAPAGPFKVAHVRQGDTILININTVAPRFGWQPKVDGKLLLLCRTVLFSAEAAETNLQSLKMVRADAASWCWA